MAQNNVDEMAEPTIFIWLDDTIENTVASREFKTHIRHIVKGRLQTFSDPDECLDYLTDDITQKIFLIISNKFGGYIVPFIHDAEQIDTIYVYCGNRQAAESWSKSYSKVRGIFTKKEPLLKQICESAGPGNKEEDLSMSVFRFANQQHALQKLSDQCTKFLWYQAILMVLLRMAKYFDSKDDMIKVAREHYHKNNAQQRKIDEFELTYKPDKAFFWYTRDSFVYRLLNRSLRTQDIDIIFKFRFFIKNLHDEIEKLYREYLKNHKEKQLTFYRGQQMGMDEVKVLKTSTGGLISMNSFLSTSRDQQVVESYIGADAAYNEKSGPQPVLLIINVCDIDEDTTPFAFIAGRACIPDEEEVLFTIGAIFIVESVEKKQNIWHVHLKLSKQKQNQQHMDFSTNMMKQLGAQPSPIAFGWFLFRMADFNGAMTYANNILKQPSMEAMDIGDAYNLSGLIHKDRNRPQESVDCYNKALEAYSHSSCADSPQVIGIHHNATAAYLAMDNKELADEHQAKAELLLKKSPYKADPLLIAMSENLKGKLQAANGDYRNAFRTLEEALAKSRKGLPQKDPSFAPILNDMGIVQEKLGDNAKALEYFKEALACCDCLTAEHPDSAEYHANIGRIYFKGGEYESAKYEFDLACTIMIAHRLEDDESFFILLKYIADTNEQIYSRYSEEENK